MKDHLIFAFTGTRAGLTEQQLDRLTWLLIFGNVWSRPSTRNASALVHGGARGADTTMDRLARRLLIPTRVIRPTAARGPLLRNRDIVARGEVLLAAPRYEFEEDRSGTWATVRLARKQQMPVVIVWPNGRMARERCLGTV